MSHNHKMPKYPTPSGIGLQDRRNDPYHDPMHNIIVPHKQGRYSVKCLGCGKHIRFTHDPEASPAKDADELGGVKPSRWFCSKLCFDTYTLITGQKKKSRSEAIIDRMMTDYTGGAKPLDSRSICDIREDMR